MDTYQTFLDSLLSSQFISQELFLFFPQNPQMGLKPLLNKQKSFVGDRGGEGGRL